MSFTCDKCSEPATCLQPRYQGNSNDRNGPTVLQRCDKHRDPKLPADPVPIPFSERQGQ